MRAKTKLALAGAVAATALGGGHAVATNAKAPSSQALPVTHGRAVFTKAACGGCHTLAAARAKGKVGPTLDGSKLTAAQIGTVVRQGKGGMPSFKSRLKPVDIQHLAAYVVAVRTKTAVKVPEATTGGAVWAKGGCGGCHTLAAAGATATKGPSLDERKPTVDQIIDTVTLGPQFGGEMPAYRSRLTSNEIRLVAEYIASVRKP